MKLTNEDVNEILRLMDSSSFDELRLEDGSFKLHITRGASAKKSADITPQRSAESPVSMPVANTTSSSAQKQPEPQAAIKDSADVDDGLIDLRAPMLGTFYTRPKPGAEPFVSVGAVVDADAIVCIIEVMKLMNSVEAGTRAEIVQICATEGEVVEYDQLLMRMRRVKP